MQRISDYIYFAMFLINYLNEKTKKKKKVASKRIFLKIFLIIQEKSNRKRSKYEKFPYKTPVSRF